MDENKELRKLLWLTHYNHFKHLYGDDGEMQCFECRLDFKRDSIEDIKAGLTFDFFGKAKRYKNNDKTDGKK